MNEIKGIKNIINQLYYILDSKQRKKIVGLFVIVIIGAFFELLGVSAVVPFIESLINPQALSEKWYIKSINYTSQNGYMIFAALILVIVYLLKNLYLVVSNYVQIKFRCQFQKDLSQKMLETYLKRPYTFFLDINSSQILRGIGSDVSGVYSVIEYGFRLFTEIITCMLIGVYILYLDWFMAAGILILALGTMLTVTKRFKKQLAQMGADLRVYSARQNKYAYQAITGNKEIKVMNRTKNFVQAYSDASDKAKSISIRYNFISSLPERIIETVCICGFLVVVCIRISFGIDASMFIEKLGAFAMAAFRIMPSVSRMTSNLNGIVFSKAALNATYLNLQEVENYEKEQSLYTLKKVGNIESISNLENDGKKIIKFKKNITIKNIYWSYPHASAIIFDNASLVINKGESVGIVGPSGGGKTTLADIILGLLQPLSGTVEMDGIDIYTIPEQWSQTIGYVPQQVFLIDDSIRNNVTFGMLENEIDDMKVWESLEQAMLKEFVSELPEGINTIVGERGVKLSGGQKQRLAIARALYYNPEILVLDEATAALDNETENALMESIEALQGHKTLIIVAHRLTTIEKCDKIYEVNKGRIVLKEKHEVIKA